MEKWYDVYKSVSLLLLKFYNVHKENSGKELYNRCFSKYNFRAINPWVLKFDSAFQIRSLDPIHIFSSFNGSSLSKKRRVERINLIIEILATPLGSVEDIDFTGCPSPLIISMMSARIEEEQIQIWDIFQLVIRNKQEALSQEVFDKVVQWYGIDITSFTIFLFWVDSDNFLPLDKNTVKLLMEASVVHQRPKSYNEYKDLLPENSSTFYKQISRFTYDIKSNPSIKQQFLKDVSEFFNRKKLVTNNIDFKIIALVPLEGVNPLYSKVLKVGEIFCFYNCFSFFGDIIKYDPGKDAKIYNQNNIDINICSIVGRNGSGKSSISELLYLAINNIAYKLLGKKDLLYVDGLYLELYYKTEDFLKIVFKGKDILLFKYHSEELTFSYPEEIPLSNLNLSNFFYTVSLNYSHYSLNSLDIGKWIEKLFHKNDAYQTPIVINPMRTKGNFDINKEKSLVNSRLLALILEPIDENSSENLRKITDNGRSVTRIKLSLNKKKAKDIEVKDIPNSMDFQNKSTLLKLVYVLFQISPSQVPEDVKEVIENYIYRKLIKIATTYSPYKKYKEEVWNVIDKDVIKEYFGRINDDKSHITFKLKQALNYLKYNTYSGIELDVPIDIERLSERIEKVKLTSNLYERQKTIELIPPSIFEVEMFLEDNSSFNELSSGEKQKIYTISSLIYHFINLNSVSTDNDLIGYRFINILFDEVELYYHPEMQRTFINYLLNYIKKIELENIFGLNFCFITHSPFILSDIPSNNILFLNDNGMPEKETEKLQTFGANIHDLLADSFFLNKGFIGSFSEAKINLVIDWCNSINNELNNGEAKKIIEIVDDPIIKIKLLEMYANRIGENFEVARLRAQQDYIQKRLKDLGQL